MPFFRALTSSFLLLAITPACLAVNEGLDARLALSIAKLTVSDEIKNQENQDCIATLYACYRSLGDADFDTARKEINSINGWSTREGSTSDAINSDEPFEKSGASTDATPNTKQVLLTLISTAEEGVQHATSLLNSLPPKPMAPESASEASRQLASDYNHLRARLLCKAGEYHDALGLLMEVAQERRGRLGANHRGVIAPLIESLDVYLVLADSESAYDFSSNIFTKLAEHCGEELFNELVALHARALNGTGRCKQAIELIQDRITKCSSKQQQCKASMLATASLCHHRLGQNKQALKFAEEACEMYEVAGSIDHLSYCQSLHALARAQVELGKKKEARQTAKLWRDSLNTHTAFNTCIVDFKIFTARYAVNVEQPGEPEAKAMEALRDCYNECASKGWSGCCEQIAVQLALLLHDSEKYGEAKLWIAEHRPKEPTAELSPRANARLYLYCSCLAKLGDWKKSYHQLHPFKDAFLGCRDDIEFGLARLYTIAVGQTKGWPQAIELSESILDVVTDQAAGQKTGNEEHTTRLVVAWQTLIKVIIASGDDESILLTLEQAALAVADSPSEPSIDQLPFLLKKGMIALERKRYAIAEFAFDRALNILETHEAFSDTKGISPDALQTAIHMRDRARRLAAKQGEPE